MKIVCRPSWLFLPLLLSTSTVRDGHAQRTSVVASSTLRLRGLIGDTTSNNNDPKGDAGFGPGAGGGAGAAATDSTTTSSKPDETKPGAGSGGGTATTPGSGGAAGFSGGPGDAAPTTTDSTTTTTTTTTTTDHKPPNDSNGGAGSGGGPTKGGGAATGPDATTTATGPNATAENGGPDPLPSNSSDPATSSTNSTSSTQPPQGSSSDGATIIKGLGGPSGIEVEYTVVNGNVEFPPNSTHALWVEKALEKLKAQNPGFTGESGGDSSSSSSSSSMPGIIDGVPATSNEFPFMVLANGGECGGTLVAKDVVMTAAHCRGIFGGRVLVGAYRRNSTEGGAEWRKVLSTMQVHPDYDPEFSYNDVMLFQIEPSTLQPVELSADPTDDPVPGANLTVAGFGIVSNTRPRVSQLLRKATVQSLDDQICVTLWDYVSSASFIQPDIMTCTMGIYNDGEPKGFCAGDSGGPLLDEAGKQVGIVSANAGFGACGAPIAPDVYTRVTGVIDFVQEAICKLTSDPSALPFTCPDLVCPADVTVLGFEDIKVPSAAVAGVRSFNGFDPVTVTQLPRAGSTLGFGKDTSVKVTATDSTGTSITCRWTVSSPPDVYLGAAAILVSPGSSTTRAAFFMGGNGPGLVLWMEGSVDSGSLGPRGVASARLRVGPANATVTTPPLALTDDFPFNVVFFADDPIPITYESNPRVVTAARNVRRGAVLIYFLYGQQTDFFGLF